MAWSETMFTIQHFYNAFDINNRLIKLENKTPFIVAKDDNGGPQGIDSSKLTEGTLWFIEEE